MKKKINSFKLFLFHYIIFIIFMIFYRFIFLFKNKPADFNEIPLKIILKSFFIGWKFDNAIAFYLLFLLFPFYYLWKLLSGTKKEKLALYLFFFVFLISYGLVFLGLIIDTEYYKTFNIHLNIMATEYFGTFSEIFQTILADYPVFWDIFIWLLTLFLFLAINIKFFQKNYRIVNKKNIIEEIIFVILFFICGIISIRGGIGVSTLNWGNAYFSKYNFANQLALNGIFTLGKSIDIELKEKKKNITQFKFYDEVEAENFIQNLLFGKNEKKILSKNPLLRHVRNSDKVKKYNVVLILMENWTGEFVGALGSELDVTPEFDKLAKKGILFTNFYATGIRTNRGFLSSICSFPSEIGTSVMKKAAGQQPFQSLPVILKERGYTSSFIYGGDIEFDNMKGFLINNGVENFISIKDFKNEELEGKWGAKDEFLFSKAAEFLDKQPEPFFSIIMTLSNHEPFDGIDKKFQKFSEKDHKEWKYLNAYYYSDYALGEFFRKIENKKFAKNTIFIMVADHGKNLKRNVDIDWRRFHIPCLIYTPSNILKPAKINKVASQTDILPTVMNLLGGDYISASWGQNLFQDNNKNFAHFIQDKTIGVISDNFLLVDNLYSEPKLFALSDLDCKNNLSDSLIQVKEEMKKISRIILQISEKQVKTRALGK